MVFVLSNKCEVKSMTKRSKIYLTIYFSSDQVLRLISVLVTCSFLRITLEHYCGNKFLFPPIFQSYILKNAYFFLSLCIFIPASTLMSLVTTLILLLLSSTRGEQGIIAEEDTGKGGRKDGHCDALDGMGEFQEIGWVD